MMIRRSLQQPIQKALKNMPVVALLGPRQVGKTTLALEIAQIVSKQSAYLDLELDTDLAKLSDAVQHLATEHRLKWNGKKPVGCTEVTIGGKTIAETVLEERR